LPSASRLDVHAGGVLEMGADRLYGILSIAVRSNVGSYPACAPPPGAVGHCPLLYIA
jgi:hypothetical protein